MLDLLFLVSFNFFVRVITIHSSLLLIRVHNDIRCTVLICLLKGEERWHSLVNLLLRACHAGMLLNGHRLAAVSARGVQIRSRLVILTLRLEK